MKITRSEVRKFVKGVIESDINDGLLERLMKESHIFGSYNPFDRRALYEHSHIRRFTEILNLIPRQASLKVCDVGSGPGFLCIFLRTKCGCQVEAVDLRESASFWKERFGKYGITPRGADVTKDPLPFDDESFDIVIFSEIIEHLPIPPSKPLLEIRRILRPSGYLILTTPNICRFTNIATLAFGRSFVPPISEITLTSNIKTPHVKEYTLEEIKALITDAGLIMDKAYLSRCWDMGLTNPLFRIFNELVMLFLPRYRSNIIIRAKK